MKCLCCNRLIRKKWNYCPNCGYMLKVRKFKKYDKEICVNCGYARARHNGLWDKLGACIEFKAQKSTTKPKASGHNYRKKKGSQLHNTKR